MTTPRTKLTISIATLFAVVISAVWLIHSRQPRKLGLQREPQPFAQYKATQKSGSIDTAGSDLSTISTEKPRPEENFKLVKAWPDGTLIYHRLGMQVTVLPSGDLLYLPDQI